jgi:hypothetical protein
VVADLLDRDACSTWNRCRALRSGRRHRSSRRRTTGAPSDRAGGRPGRLNQAGSSVTYAVRQRSSAILSSSGPTGPNEEGPRPAIGSLGIRTTSSWWRRVWPHYSPAPGSHPMPCPGHIHRIRRSRDRPPRRAGLHPTSDKPWSYSEDPYQGAMRLHAALNSPTAYTAACAPSLNASPNSTTASPPRPRPVARGSRRPGRRHRGIRAAARRLPAGPGPDRPDTLAIRHELARWRGSRRPGRRRHRLRATSHRPVAGCSALIIPTRWPTVATSPTGMARLGTWPRPARRIVCSRRPRKCRKSGGVWVLRGCSDARDHVIPVGWCGMNGAPNGDKVPLSWAREHRMDAEASIFAYS